MTLTKDQAESLRAELELVHSSLLPAEETLLIQSAKSVSTITFTPETTYQELQLDLPITVDIESRKNHFSLRVMITSHPINTPDDVSFQIRSSGMDRGEAEGWASWIAEQVESGWDEGLDSGFPLYTLVVEKFLPVLQHQPDALASAEANPASNIRSSQDRSRSIPTEVLFTSHHLLALSKRRDLHSLSSSLGTFGFAKTGHPGIIYALCPSEQDAEEFVREVKSWQWLALKLRVVQGVDEQVVGAVRVSRSDIEATQAKWKGSWSEVEKMGEALEWMRFRKRDFLLLDAGFGAGGKA